MDLQVTNRYVVSARNRPFRRVAACEGAHTNVRIQPPPPWVRSRVFDWDLWENLLENGAQDTRKDCA